MHTYKLRLVQELSERDWETCRTLCQEVQHVPRAAVMLFRDEAHFNVWYRKQTKLSVLGGR